MASDIIHRIGEDMLPIPVQKFFTPQRAPDMWFSDELPPTYQAMLNDPSVQQAKMLFQYRVMMALAEGDQQRAAQPKTVARPSRRRRRR